MHHRVEKVMQFLACSCIPCMQQRGEKNIVRLAKKVIVVAVSKITTFTQVWLLVSLKNTKLNSLPTTKATGTTLVVQTLQCLQSGKKI